MRECLQDVFDVPGLVGLMREVEERTVRFVEVETQQPSPFARSLLFGYVAQFLYEGDSPLAERRAAALSLDATLLAELLGQQGYGGLRELLDPDAVAALARDLQRLSEDRRARDAEGVADLLRVLGPLTTAEAVERGAQPAWLADLEEARRAVRVRVAGEERWVAVEDAGRLRDALGTPLPVGIPDAFLEPLKDPIGDLVARYARTHVPFTTADVALRLGLGPAVVEQALARLAGVRPGGRRRVPARRCRAGVVRRRGAAHPAPAVAGRAAQGGRAGAGRGAGLVPAGLAAGGRPAARGRGRAARGRAAPGRAGAGLVARVAGAAGARRRLLPRPARRAVRGGRGPLARPRLAARRRRLGVAAPGRLRPR